MMPRAISHRTRPVGRPSSSSGLPAAASRLGRCFRGSQPAGWGAPARAKPQVLEGCRARRRRGARFLASLPASRMSGARRPGNRLGIKLRRPFGSPSECNSHLRLAETPCFEVGRPRTGLKSMTRGEESLVRPGAPPRETGLRAEGRGRRRLLPCPLLTSTFLPLRPQTPRSQSPQAFFRQECRRACFPLLIDAAALGRRLAVLLPPMDPGRDLTFCLLPPSAPSSPATLHAYSRAICAVAFVPALPCRCSALYACLTVRLSSALPPTDSSSRELLLLMLTSEHGLGLSTCFLLRRVLTPLLRFLFLFQPRRLPRPVPRPSPPRSSSTLSLLQSRSEPSPSSAGASARSTSPGPTSHGMRSAPEGSARPAVTIT